MFLNLEPAHYGSLYETMGSYHLFVDPRPGHCQVLGSAGDSLVAKPTCCSAEVECLLVFSTMRRAVLIHGAVLVCRHPWALFLAGSCETHGVLRLLRAAVSHHFGYVFALDLDAQTSQNCTWDFPCCFPPTRLATSLHPCHWRCLILRRASLHLGAKNHPFLKGLARWLDESGKHRLWYSLSKWMLPCIVCHQPWSWGISEDYELPRWMIRKPGSKAAAFPNGLYQVRKTDSLFCESFSHVVYPPHHKPFWAVWATASYHCSCWGTNDLPLSSGQHGHRPKLSSNVTVAGRCVVKLGSWGRLRTEVHRGTCKQTGRTWLSKVRKSPFVSSCFIREIRKWIEGAAKLRFLLTDNFKQFDAL